jgi:hypothetical protein
MNSCRQLASVQDYYAAFSRRPPLAAQLIHSSAAPQLRCPEWSLLTIRRFGIPRSVGLVAAFSAPNGLHLAVGCSF